mgnify:FL=1
MAAFSLIAGTTRNFVSILNYSVFEITKVFQEKENSPRFLQYDRLTMYEMSIISISHYVPPFARF